MRQAFLVTVDSETTINPGQIGDAVQYGIDGPEVGGIAVERIGESEELQEEQQHEED